MGLSKVVHLFLLIFWGTLSDASGGQESCPLVGCSACIDGILECINFTPFNQTDIDYLDIVPQITEAHLWSNPRVEPDCPWSEAVKDIDEQFLSQRDVTDDFQSETNLTWSDAVGNHTKNFIRDIQKGLFFEMGITHVTKEDFTLFGSLSYLGLAYNNIQRITDDVFPQTLKALDLSYNDIQQIDSGTLPPDLEELCLNNNEIEEIGLHVLPSQLSILDLAYNDIEEVGTDILPSNLSTLILISNFITNIGQGELPENLQKLILDNNDLRNVDKGALPQSLTYVSVDKYSVCCFVNEQVECIAPPSSFATCDGLLQHWGYRVSAWVISVVALMTNLIALHEQVVKKTIPIHRFVPTIKTNANVFLAGLALSDFLMGIYLLSIAVADAWFGSDYFTVYSETWQTGAVCSLIGIIGNLSIVGSLLNLTVLAIDRFVWILFPKGKVCFNRIWADTVCVIIWVLGTLVAILPLLLAQKFKDFYDHSDVCLSLPIVAVSKRVESGFDWQNQLFLLKGYTTSMGGVVWTYSLLIYTCLSTVCILITTFCYTIALIAALQSKQNFLPKGGRNSDILLATKMSIMVGIDVLCWLCVITLAVLSQLHIVTPNKVNPWLVVFVLPLKSALNPLIYSYGNILTFPKTLKRSLVQMDDEHMAYVTFPGVDQGR